MGNKTKSKSKKRQSETIPNTADAKKAKDDNSSSDSDEELKEPTQEEIAESMKPENVINIETARKKKQKKYENKIKKDKEEAESSEITKNVDYLRLWDKNITEWKFIKLRQISIQKNVFNPEKLPQEVWEIALSYLGGSKGASKEQLQKNAEEIIKKYDEEGLPSTLDDTNKTIYNRARELIQILQ